MPAHLAAKKYNIFYTFTANKAVVPKPKNPIDKAYDYMNTQMDQFYKTSYVYSDVDSAGNHLLLLV
jgi:hypothetical protein